MADEIQNAEVIAVASSNPAGDVPGPTQTAARFDRVDWLSFAATALIALAGYFFTLAPNVTMGWSGVLSTSAAYAGVGPPPGNPAWTLYSWCFVELLPFSNVARRVAVGSAVASAIACGLVSLMVSRAGLVLFENANPFANLETRERTWLRLFCSVVAGLVLAFSGVIWKYAVIVETRSLSLLLFVAIVCLFFRWALEPERRMLLCGAFFLFGLLLSNGQEFLVLLPGLLAAIMVIKPQIGCDVALAVLPVAAVTTIRNQTSLWVLFPDELNWPLLVAFCGVGFTALLLAIRPLAIDIEWKCALGCVVMFLLGQAFYLYVPLASMTTPPVNWGYPRIVEGFWHALSRGQWERIQPTSDFGRYAGQSWEWLRMTGSQFGWLYLFLALLPFVCARHFTKFGRRLLVGFTLMWLCVTFLALAELNPPPDRQAWDWVGAYFAASQAILAVWLGLGLIIVGAKFSTSNQSRTPTARSA